MSNANLEIYPAPPGLKPGWFIALGLILIALGILAAWDAVATSLASVIVLGTLLVAGGVAQIVVAISYRDLPLARPWLGVLMGLLYVVAGILMIEEPATGSVFITAVLAGCLIFAGLARTFWAAEHRYAKGWGLLIISGLFTLVIGIGLYLTLPWSALWLIGMFVAFELLMAGTSVFLFGLSLRDAAR